MKYNTENEELVIEDLKYDALYNKILKLEQRVDELESIVAELTTWEVVEDPLDAIANK